MQLRKCCAHPSLLSPSPGIQQDQKLAEYIAASGKLALLDQMVRYTCSVTHPYGTVEFSWYMLALQCCRCILPPQVPNISFAQCHVNAHHINAWLEQVGLLRERGHRTLIYSQFTMLLDVLEDWLIERQWPYFRLDGNIGMGLDCSARRL